MKKYSLPLLLIGTTALLTACGTMNSLQSKFANIQLQKKKLASGKTVYINYNVAPTATWACKSIGKPQFYNWQQMQVQGQFRLIGGHGLLVNNALAYANQHNLKPNYINLQIPEESTFSTGSGNFTSSLVLNPNAQAVASFYQCKLINPEHKLSYEKKKDFSVRVGD